jgi:hypothetical protein
MRAVFYGLCSRCRRRPDVDARVEERISAGEPISPAVELASGSQTFPPVLELAEWLKLFSPESREFFADRIIHPERYGGWTIPANFQKLEVEKGREPACAPAANGWRAN